MQIQNTQWICWWIWMEGVFRMEQTMQWTSDNENDDERHRQQQQQWVSMQTGDDEIGVLKCLNQVLHVIIYSTCAHGLYVYVCAGALIIMEIVCEKQKWAHRIANRNTPAERNRKTMNR